MKRQPYPWEGWKVGPVVLRFLMAGLFGVLLDGLVVVAALWILPVPATAWRILGWLLVGLPVAWGLLGIFWLERMVDAVGEIFDLFGRLLQSVWWD